MPGESDLLNEGQGTDGSTHSYTNRTVPIDNTTVGYSLSLQLISRYDIVATAVKFM